MSCTLDGQSLCFTEAHFDRHVQQVKHHTEASYKPSVRLQFLLVLRISAAVVSFPQEVVSIRPTSQLQVNRSFIPWEESPSSAVQLRIRVGSSNISS
jgi:hypothetical protein